MEAQVTNSWNRPIEYHKDGTIIIHVGPECDVVRTESGNNVFAESNPPVRDNSQYELAQKQFNESKQ